MMQFQPNPITVEPPWLQAKVDQLIARFESYAPLDQVAHMYGVLLLMLDEPAEDATLNQRARWERSCSRCDGFTQPGFPYYTGIVQREMSGVKINITFGACLPCVQTQGLVLTELTELT